MLGCRNFRKRFRNASRVMSGGPTARLVLGSSCRITPGVEIRVTRQFLSCEGASSEGGCILKKSCRELLASCPGRRCEFPECSPVASFALSSCLGVWFAGLSLQLTEATSLQRLCHLVFACFCEFRFSGNVLQRSSDLCLIWVQMAFRLSCLCWKTLRTASLWSSSCRLQILKSSEKAIGLWHCMCCEHVPAGWNLAISRAPQSWFLPLFFCRTDSRTGPKSGCSSVRLVVFLCFLVQEQACNVASRRAGGGIPTAARLFNAFECFASLFW